jgi:phosphoribosylformylglycinamidine synthase
MQFIADVVVMPLEQLLDPQGKAVEMGLNHLGLKAITNVRVGKNIRMSLEASSHEEAEKIVRTAAEKLLCNPVMEYFTLNLYET